MRPVPGVQPIGTFPAIRLAMLTSHRGRRPQPAGLQVGTSRRPHGAAALAARLVLPWLALVLAACSGRRTVFIEQRTPRLPEIQVEVYDPATNGVWEGVSVRVVEGYHEWSGCTCGAGNLDLWKLTGRDGLVLFTAGDLADADIGFREDSSGDAILSGDRDEDEAWVLVEIDAIGFDRLFVDVPVSWREPTAFISVPFSPK